MAELCVACTAKLFLQVADFLVLQSLIVVRDFLNLLRDLCICPLTIRATRNIIMYYLIIIILFPIEVLLQRLIINAVA